MSRRELDRAEWMQRLRERRTTQAQAAVHLGVTVASEGHQTRPSADPRRPDRR